MITFSRWSFFVILNAVLCISAFAQLTEGDLRLAHVGQDSTGNPNHLEPIPAFSEKGYNQAVFRTLVKGSQPKLWMVAKPSFSPEYAIILSHDVQYAADDDPFGDRRYLKNDWVLIYRKAERQIWRYTETADGQLILDLKSITKVAESRATIPRESASKLIETWKYVLLETRYSGLNYRGTDGEIYQFFCDYDLFGETWSPTAGAPLALTRLGHLLIDVVENSEAEGPELLRKAVTLARGIQSQLKEQQSKAEQ